MQARIILREIASAAVHLIRLCHTARYEFHSRANRHAIALGARQIEADPMTAWHSVIFQNHGSAVEVTHDYVHIAIIKEIVDGQTS